MTPEDMQIFRQCIEREESGLDEYGEFDPVGDSRNMYQEMIEELYDVINYARFQIKKLRRIDENTNRLSR